MLLEKILKDVEIKAISNYKNIEIRGITDNSKEVLPGGIFVAIDGYKTSGMNYFDEAVKRGAKAVVLSRNLNYESDIIAIYSNNPRKTMAEMLNNFHDKPSEKLKVIGITGTKGKTTTAEFLYRLLSMTNHKTVVIGTLGIRGLSNKICDKSNKTTPDAKVIYEALDMAVKDNCEYAIIEVSSQSLVQYRIWGIKFKSLIFTSFSSDHIGYGEHKNLEDYYRAKKSLFSDYKCDFAITNAEDKKGLDIVSSVKKHIKVGHGKNNDYIIGRILSRNFGSEFYLNNSLYRISLPGFFNVYNAALALSCAKELVDGDDGIFFDIMKSVRVKGRYERYFLKGRRIIIDFAHNGASFYELIKSVKECNHGRIITVYGSVGGRAKERRRDLAEIAELFSDFSVITSDNPCNEDPVSICNEIYSHYNDKNKAKIIVDRMEAILYAISFSWVGDNILLLGKGHEEYEEKNGERSEFSESEFILSLGGTREDA